MNHQHPSTGDTIVTLKELTRPLSASIPANTVGTVVSQHGVGLLVNFGPYGTKYIHVQAVALVEPSDDATDLYDGANWWDMAVTLKRQHLVPSWRVVIRRSEEVSV